MHSLALLVLLLSEHDPSHWEMSCDEWNRNRIEILSDENLNSDPHEYLIDFIPRGLGVADLPIRTRLQSMANWTQVSQLGTDFVHPRKRTQKLTEGTALNRPLL